VHVDHTTLSSLKSTLLIHEIPQSSDIKQAMAPFPLSLIFGKKKRRRDDEIRRQKPTLKGVMTAFFATEAAICLLLLAGISLTGTAVALFASMPLFLVFSPVLVPAGIATTILASGLMAGGTSGVSGLTILMWLYK